MVTEIFGKGQLQFISAECVLCPLDYHELVCNSLNVVPSTLTISCLTKCVPHLYMDGYS